MTPLAEGVFSFASTDPTQWVVLVLGVLATMYLILRARSRKKPDPLKSTGVQLSLAQQRQVERDLQRLMVELLDTARQITGQVELRSRKLEVLIADADQRIERLRIAESPAAAQSPGAPPPAAPISPNEAAATPPEPANIELPPDPRHAEVYALADEGSTTFEIARRLNRPNGEIELILALRRA